MFSQHLEPLRSLLSQNRFDHSVRVAQTAQKLAQFWGENQFYAYLAGLLHDAAKHLDPDKWAALNFPEPSFSRSFYKHYPAVWHARVAPAILGAVFKVKTAAVLNAARWHTTGKANMSRLEQILLIADFIEPGRSFAEVPYIDQLAYKDLDQATYALSMTVMMTLVKAGVLIHPDTFRCREFYIQRLGQAVVKEISQTIVSISNTQ